MVGHLKAYLNIQPGDRTLILIKLCQSGQTDHYMLGYVQKDSSMAHIALHFVCADNSHYHSVTNAWLFLTNVWLYADHAQWDSR